MRGASVSALCALLVLACGGPGTSGTGGNPLTQPSYYPLAVGNEWTYRVKQGDGTIVEKTRRVVGRRAFAGAERWVLESVENGEKLVALTDYEASTGVRRYRDEHYDLHTGTLVEANEYVPFTLRTPPLSSGREIDETYTVRDLDHTGALVGTRTKIHRWSVVSRDEQVVVPAGTFRTIHVRRLNQDGSKTRDYWLAPGVGKVKETGDFLEELESYQVAE